MAEKDPKDMAYLLMTVAYNEERQIAQAIECVLGQSVLPRRWFIVSDGSTDGTDRIIQGYAQKFPWVRYERLEKVPGKIPTLGKASFAYARAWEHVRKLLGGLDYDFFGNLDADITFEPAYFERLLAIMSADDRLGICGGGAYSVLENGESLAGGFIQPDFVGGPVQFFRKECLEDIDGYHPYDHADVVAVTMARMKGWKVRCFPEIRALHHGQPGNSVKEKVPICFQMGQADYVAGNYAPFILGRCVLRSFHKPVLFAGLSMLAGYLWAGLSRKERRMPRDVLAYMRRDQKRQILVSLGLSRTNPYRI